MARLEICPNCLEANRLLWGEMVYFPSGRKANASKIMTQRAEGMKLKDIALEHGISIRRVQQILQGRISGMKRSLGKVS